jgi:hypothetical protein
MFRPECSARALSMRSSSSLVAEETDDQRRAFSGSMLSAFNRDQADELSLGVQIKRQNTAAILEAIVGVPKFSAPRA